MTSFKYVETATYLHYLLNGWAEMSENTTSIERLPEETRSKLRSTQILTSLPQIVTELMQNALDANASHIDIGIDYKEWMCWVRDNGEGINKDGLEKLGEGSRYCVSPVPFPTIANSRFADTSKEYTPGFINSASAFGFRGEGEHVMSQLRERTACLQMTQPWPLQQRSLVWRSAHVPRSRGTLGH